MIPISPKETRYIKLGEQNRWAARAIDQGELHFGYQSVPHEMCLQGDWNAVAEFLAQSGGQGMREARNAAREVRDFYTLGADGLWITIFDKHLWWTFADPEVKWLGPETAECGVRMRKAIGGWRKVNIAGEPLKADQLSTRLTQLNAYRMTICSVRAADYLVRRINAAEEPVIAKAEQARSLMVAAAQDMITGLHWAEFEIMVDLIFTRGGWQRESTLGGTMADVDLVLRHPLTAEKAFVQVKSRADQKVIDDYVSRYHSSNGYDRMFFICHSPRGKVKMDQGPNIHVWLGAALAETAISAGLFDWLIERSR
jgi:hypothetical protein